MSKSPQRRRNSPSPQRRRSRSPPRRRYSRSPPRRRRHSRSPPKRKSYGTEDEKKSSKTIYLGNLSYNVEKNDLEDSFSKYGKIEKITIGRDRLTHKSIGFAFVEFDDRKDAEAAYSDFENKDFHGRVLRLDWDIGQDKKKERRPTRRSPPRRRYSRSPPRRSSPRRRRSGSPPRRRRYSGSPKRRSTSPSPKHDNDNYKK